MKEKWKNFTDERWRVHDISGAFTIFQTGAPTLKFEIEIVWDSLIDMPSYDFGKSGRPKAPPPDPLMGGEYTLCRDRCYQISTAATAGPDEQWQIQEKGHATDFSGTSFGNFR